MEIELQNQKFEEFMLKKSSILPKGIPDEVFKLVYVGGLLDGLKYTLNHAPK